MKNRILSLLLAVGVLVAASNLYAASNRPTWVVNEVYSNNHTYAATDSLELARKITIMATSPFLFFRGTNHIFFRDMWNLPGSAYATTQTGYTWVDGDMHLTNFGADRDRNNDHHFAVNDFDEGYLGQYVWDLRRLATSFVLAGREMGISDADITTAINTLIGSYVDKMADFKGNDAELTYKLKSGDTTGVIKDLIESSKTDTRTAALDKFTLGGKFVSNNPELIPVSTSTYSAMTGAMSAYIASIPPSKRESNSYYVVKDIRQKLYTGVGSLGKLRFYILIEGPSSSNMDDRILEVKQMRQSVVERVSNGRLPAYIYDDNEGCRVAKTMRAQLIDTDALVGCSRAMGIDFYYRERSPYKEGFDYTALTSGGKMNTAADYFGKALASAHAVSDQDYDSAIVPYSIDKQVSDAVTSKSGLKAEIVAFAFDYVTQVNLDWQAFVAAKNAGTPLY